MARSSSSVESSLELLLDTICNTFGGILFMALLVCLLTSQHGGAVTPKKADDVIRRVNQQRLRQLELESIQQQIRALKTSEATQLQLAESLQDDSGAASLRKVVVLQNEQHLVLNDLATTRANIDHMRGEIEVLCSQAAQMASSADAARVRSAEAQRVTDEQKQKQTVRLRLPLVKPTGKRQAAVVLLRGKLYMPRLYDRDGISTAMNFDDLDAGTSADRIAESDFKANGGIEVVNSAESIDATRKRLNDFDSKRSYIFFAVWPDSYEQFRVLRDRVVDQGFEYQLLLMDRGDVLSYGTTTRSEVQ